MTVDKSERTELTTEERETLIRGGFDLTPAKIIRTAIIGNYEVTEWDKGGISITMGEKRRTTLFFGAEGTRQLAEWFKGFGASLRMIQSKNGQEEKSPQENIPKSRNAMAILPQKLESQVSKLYEKA